MGGTNISLEKIKKQKLPKFADTIKKVEREQSKLGYGEAKELLTLIANDASNEKHISFDIIDKGIGIHGHDFESTILSIHNGNKSHVEKSYLIGTFGQGGSTSLGYTRATLIISKKDNKLSYTIIKAFDKKENKMPSYYYLVDECTGQPFSVDNYSLPKELYDVLNTSESFTFVKMIDTNISPKYLGDITKPKMLYDYINTEIPDLPYPIFLRENRSKYREQGSHQRRYSYGLFKKMMSSKHVPNEYLGEVEIEHHGRTVKVKYYAILPIDQEEWGHQGKCKDVYEQFNTTTRSLLYISGGQYISGEGFTKFKNKGLSFLQYRLLMIVDIDVFERDKYKFFTSNRSGMTNHEITHGLFEKIVERISEQQTLIELNRFIMEKSSRKSIDLDLTKELNSNINKFYNGFLKGTRGKKIEPGRKMTRKNIEIIYEDAINSLSLSDINKDFFKNEKVNLYLATGAIKSVNEKAKISMFVNGKDFHDFDRSVMEGRIQYSISSLNPGEYEVQFIYFKDDLSEVESETRKINIINEIKSDGKQSRDKELNLSVIDVIDTEYITNLDRNERENKITISINLTHELLINFYEDYFDSDEEIQEFKLKLRGALAFNTIQFETNKIKTYTENKDLDVFDEMGETFDNMLTLSFVEAYYLSDKFSKKQFQ